MSKKVVIYYQAVTKVQAAHAVLTEPDIDTAIKTWVKQGYVIAKHVNGKNTMYIPWSNVVYCQAES